MVEELPGMKALPDVKQVSVPRRLQAIVCIRRTQRLTAPVREQMRNSVGLTPQLLYVG